MSGDPLGTLKKLTPCVTIAETAGYAIACDTFEVPGEWTYEGGSGIYAAGNNCTWGWSENPVCKKVRYSGSSKSCCLTGQGEINIQKIPLGLRTIDIRTVRTCDPKFITNRQRSAECRMEFVDACANPTTADCRAWVNANSTDSQVINIMDNFCANPTNMNTKFCQDWCYAHPGGCDRGMTEFCKNKPYNNDLCSCITSPAKGIINPACVDTYCRNTGYKLRGMDTTTNKCPDVVDCSIVNNLNAESAGRIQFGSLVMKQNCGNTPVTNTSPVPPAVIPGTIDNDAVDRGVGSGSSGSSGGTDNNTTTSTIDAIKSAIKNKDLSSLDTKEKGIFGLFIFIIILSIILPIGIIGASLSGNKAKTLAPSFVPGLPYQPIAYGPQRFY